MDIISPMGGNAMATDLDFDGLMNELDNATVIAPAIGNYRGRHRMNNNGGRRLLAVGVASGWLFLVAVGTYTVLKMGWVERLVSLVVDRP